MSFSIARRKRAARADEMLLTHELVERARPHASGQRRRGVALEEADALTRTPRVQCFFGFADAAGSAAGAAVSTGA